jgi:hypothetical protein
MTRSVVAPALMVVGVKDLETVGRLGVMVSRSAAVQVPELQATFVLLTPEGTEMVAVLTTWVWEYAGKWENKAKRAKHRPPHSVPVDNNLNLKASRRLNTFCLQNFKKLSPTTRINMNENALVYRNKPLIMQVFNLTPQRIDKILAFCYQ